MEEIIIPDDGIIYKTKNGKPAFELLADDLGNVFRIYDVNANVRIGLSTQEKESSIIIGDLNSGNALTISVDEELTEIEIENSKKRIVLGINQ